MSVAGVAKSLERSMDSDDFITPTSYGILIGLAIVLVIAVLVFW